MTKSQKYKDKEEKGSWPRPVSAIYAFQQFFFLTANIFAPHTAEPEEKITNSLYLKIPKTWTKSNLSLWVFCLFVCVFFLVRNGFQLSYIPLAAKAIFMHYRFLPLECVQCGTYCKNHVCILIDIFPFKFDICWCLALLASNKSKNRLPSQLQYSWLKNWKRTELSTKAMIRRHRQRVWINTTIF